VGGVGVGSGAGGARDRLDVIAVEKRKVAESSQWKTPKGQPVQTPSAWTHLRIDRERAIGHKKESVMRVYLRTLC
jgi:hypothetical protein